MTPCMQAMMYPPSLKVSLSEFVKLPPYLEPTTQPTFTSSKSTIKTLEKDAKYIQSSQQKHQNDIIDVNLMILLLILNIFHIFF